MTKRFKQLEFSQVVQKCLGKKWGNDVLSRFPSINRVFTWSCKRPANFQQMYLKCMLDVCWIM